MEVLAWLWLYDKRWLFGIKQPSVTSVWMVPFIQNIIFSAILIYYMGFNKDECYFQFEAWIQVRLFILGILILNILWLFYETSRSYNKENQELELYKRTNPFLLKKHNYWLRRKVLISCPGKILLMAGLVNWFWTLAGVNIIYDSFLTYSSCTFFNHSIIWGNLLLTLIFALPVWWVLFWMLFIKIVSLLMGIMCPSVLIWIKKKANPMD